MEETTGYSVSKLSAAEAAALLAAGAVDRRGPLVTVDPKQIALGIISACSVMMFILLMCVLISYLSMAALNAF